MIGKTAIQLTFISVKMTVNNLMILFCSLFKIQAKSNSIDAPRRAVNYGAYKRGEFCEVKVHALSAKIERHQSFPERTIQIGREASYRMAKRTD